MECGHEHEKAIKIAKEGMPEEEVLARLASLFQTFSDPTRVKILFALMQTELCVSAISELLSTTQPAVSYQLKLLKKARLVGCRREGKCMIYYLKDDHVRTIIAQGFAHISEKEDDDE